MFYLYVSKTKKKRERERDRDREIETSTDRVHVTESIHFRFQVSNILSRISHPTPTSITQFAWFLHSYKDIILNKKRILLLDSELWACQNGVIERLNLLSSSFFKCQIFYIIHCIRLLQILSDLHDSFNYLWIDLLISSFIVPNKKIIKYLDSELWTCQNRLIERPNLFSHNLHHTLKNGILQFTQFLYERRNRKKSIWSFTCRSVRPLNLLRFSRPRISPYLSHKRYNAIKLWWRQDSVLLW